MRNQRGFVMADAMIALVLVSLLLVALLDMNRNSAELADRTEERLTAAIIAQSLLEEENGQSKQGETKVDDRIYRWNVTVRDITGENRPRMKLEEIAVSVSWGGNRAKKEISLITARTRGIT